MFVLAFCLRLRFCGFHGVFLFARLLGEIFFGEACETSIHPSGKEIEVPPSMCKKKSKKMWDLNEGLAETNLCSVEEEFFQNP